MKKIILITMLMSAVFAQSDCNKDNWQEYYKSGWAGRFLKGEGDGKDMSDCYLADANLTGAVLRGAVLTEADLTDADLTDAKLEGADLRGADLTDAKLEGADLRGADLTDAKLEGADLRGAKLIWADLTEADLTDAILEGVISRGIRGEPRSLSEGWRLVNRELISDGGESFNDCNESNWQELWPFLYNCNFFEVDLSGEFFYQVGGLVEHGVKIVPDLSGANLGSANLTDANLTTVNLTDANLEGANLTDANLTLADLTGANLSGANLTDAILAEANLTEANLTGVKSGGIKGRQPSALPERWILSKGYLIGPGADLSGANLSGAYLEGAYLEGANLDDVKSGGITGKPSALPEGWVLIDGYLSSDASYALGNLDNDSNSSDLDSDQDGVVSFKDLLDILDKNENNLLEASEYSTDNESDYNASNIIIVSKKDKAIYMKEIEPIFVMLDLDEDGKISLEEALDEIDRDKDGIIELEEYEDFISQEELYPQ